MIPTGLVLVGKPGCHLCDEVRPVVAEIAATAGLAFHELSITDDPALAAEFFELIPVVLLDGEVVAFWTVVPDELRARVARWKGPAHKR